MNVGEARTKPQLIPWTSLEDFSQINYNKKCFIVAAGPSISFLNLSKIHSNIVISVNSSILLMPWMDNEQNENKRFWMSTDSLCMSWDYFWSRVVKSSCIKIVRDNWRKNKKLCEYQFRYFSSKKTENMNDEGLFSSSSVLSALNFAILMGCNPIYMLGVDHRMLHDKSHFWQFYDKSVWPQRKDKNKYFIPCQRQQCRVFNTNCEVFKIIYEYAKLQGISIYNCSHISVVDVFPKCSFEESLSI